MQQHVAEYAAQRVALFAICPEPVDVVAGFVSENGITYPILSDTASRLIRQLGILNTEVDESDPVYGIPYPGSYLVDEKGVVFEKRFHPDFHVREPMGSLLLYFQLREYAERLEEKVRDRTRQLEETHLRLVETARLASLGKLIAAINHELNSPLGALANGMEVVWKYFERDCAQVEPAERASILEIKEAVDSAYRRIIQVVANLREFIRLDQAEVQSVDLRQNLDAVVKLLSAQMDRRIVVERDYAEIPNLACRAPQINQALFEIVVNAVESIEGQGTITLATATEDGNVVLTVSDTGRGIPTGELDQLFEPKLRAKQGRMGMSLGLSLAHKIIHEHGGRLQVASVPGQGTSVTLSLPIAGS